MDMILRVLYSGYRVFIFLTFFALPVYVAISGWGEDDYGFGHAIPIMGIPLVMMYVFFSSNNLSKSFWVALGKEEGCVY